MLSFILKRLLKFIPLFFVISLVGFWLSSAIPGDPVEQVMVKRYGAGLNNNLLQSQQLREKLHHEMGLNRPSFYFTINGWHECDTLHRISNPDVRNVYERLCNQYGCSHQVGEYIAALSSLLENSPHHPLSKTWQPRTLLLKFSELEEPWNSLLNEKFQAITDHKSTWSSFIPTINFHGINNRYHLWLFGGTKELKGLIRGDFGSSYQTGEPVSDFIWIKLGHSLELIFISIFMAYLLSIPMGFYLSRKPSKVLSAGIMALYAIPGFLGGTLLIFFFANKGMIHLFPESGIYPLGYHPEEHHYLTNLWNALPYMVLPILTFAYSAFAFLSKLTTNLSNAELNNEYVRTAITKGRSERSIYYKEILKNIAIPFITVFVQLFPAAVGGTLVIEIVFQYPGLGKTVYEAISNHDYPVVIAAFTLTGLLTLVAYLLADILYAIVDPRIKEKL